MSELSRLQQLKTKSQQKDMTRKEVLSRAKSAPHPIQTRYLGFLEQADLAVSPINWCIGATLGSLFLAILIGQVLGPIVGAGMVPVSIYYLIFLYPSARSESRRQQIAPHLPAFVDALVASLQTGYQMELAIEHATGALPDGPLKTELLTVSYLVEHGLSLEEALENLTKKISGQEIVSLVISLRLFHGMGGSIIIPLRRLSTKMREQQAILERGSRDLIAVKQAFYVILVLSIVAPLLLLASDTSYLLDAFREKPTTYILQVAVLIQAICLVVFRKLSLLKV